VQLYFAEPYRFVPPYRSTRWCRLLAPFIPAILRWHLRVVRWELRGVDHLREALRQGAGILLTSNHCRWPDPVVLSLLGLEVGSFFHYLVAHYVFRQGRIFGWSINRIGGYGINREIADRQSLRAGARILAEGERPLVVFPEGTWYRQNDRLGPFREGLTLIAREAARHSERQLVVLPTALKYWLLEDPGPVLTRRLARLEARFGLSPQDHMALVPRVEAASAAFLAARETEHLGGPRAGLIDRRRLELAEAIVSGLEAEHGVGPHGETLMGRVLRLRQLLIRRLAEATPLPDKCAAVLRRLDHLLLVQWLNGHSHEYLCELPHWERLTEAVQRLEEIVSDEREEPVAPLGAVVEVDEPLAVREWLGPACGQRGQGARLVEELARRTQRMLDSLVAKGPPAGWRCPPVTSAAAAEAPDLSADKQPSDGR
jgi:1-acyl-sn-glycerol-3-phosphate acyltransferase